MNFNKKAYSAINDLISKEYPKVRLMIVSKNRPVESIRDALDEGALLFGENKVQEADLKFEVLRKEFPNINLHLIGPLQTNKVKQALKTFDVIQSVDREKLVKEISKNLSGLTRTKNFYIQVNIGEESQKNGIDPMNLASFLDNCRQQLNLDIVGLMCIPPISGDTNKFFKEMLNLKNQHNLSNLSMGMSSDYIEAINHEATFVRIGSKIFGNRD